MTEPKSFSNLRGAGLLAPAVIILAALAVYNHTFSVPFLLDDAASITDNATIQHGWSHGAALLPPHGGQTVDGRPLLNLSLALNYTISGSQVWSYHVLNLAIHALAGLVLFGVVRRTLLLPSVTSPTSRWRGDATWLALLVALVWVVHPLQTESVTYIVQRAESLMGLCFLLTFYFFIRGAGEKNSTGWLTLSIVACALGMATKEVMVTAPVLVLLYDRAFVAGSFRAAWQRRGRWHAGLVATWLVLAALVIGAGDRGGTIGGIAGVTWWEYALTQSRAVAHYLQLAFWPTPLIFDYGPDFIQHVAEILPYALLDVVLLALTVFGLVRRSAWGFLGAWFFLILAPTSSVVGGTRQMVSEHRMYLSLAAVIVFTVVGLYARLGRRGLLVGLALALVLGGVSVRRNEDYRSVESIWTDTVAKRPGNPWAHGNLGTAYLALGRVPEAVEQFNEAIKLRPDYAAAHDNLGNALLRENQPAEAVVHYETALRLKPQDAQVHNNLGNALLQLDRLPEAIGHYEEALRLDPAYSAAHNNLANALVHAGRVPEAIAHYEQAVQIDPAYAAAYVNLGNAFHRAGRDSEAVAQYEAALRIKPDFAEAHYNLGNVLAGAGQTNDAITHFEKAVQIDPAYAVAHNNLGNALQKTGRFAEAVTQYEAALQVVPGEATTHYNLGNALLQLHRPAEAVAQYREALRLRPGFTEARGVLDRLGALP